MDTRTDRKYKRGKKLAKKLPKIIDKSVKSFAKEVKKKFSVDSLYLFGSYAKGTQNEESDIDIAVVSSSFKDKYDFMAELMGLTWNIDARIEPHPISTSDFNFSTDLFIKEVKKTGIVID